MNKKPTSEIYYNRANGSIRYDSAKNKLKRNACFYHNFGTTTQGDAMFYDHQSGAIVKLFSATTVKEEGMKGKLRILSSDDKIKEAKKTLEKVLGFKLEAVA